MDDSDSETTRMLGALKGLYQRDPEAFEILRRQLIDHAIEGLRPESRQRARARQFALEARLARYKHPVARLNKMVEIFWEQFSQFQQVLNDPGAAAESARSRCGTGGKLIPLHKRDGLH